MIGDSVVHNVLHVHYIPRSVSLSRSADPIENARTLVAGRTAIAALLIDLRENILRVVEMTKTGCLCLKLGVVIQRKRKGHEQSKTDVREAGASDLANLVPQPVLALRQRATLAEGWK